MLLDILELNILNNNNITHQIIQQRLLLFRINDQHAGIRNF